MSTSKKVMGHVYAIFTILVWGSCFVLTKELLKGYTAIQIIPLRMGLAYVALWALRPKTLKLPWKDELMFILIGITGGSFYFFLQNTALTYTYAANVSIIVALSPILTVILAQLFSRSGERLGKYVYIGAVIAIAGVVLVVLNGQMTFHLNPLGDLIALAAALMWAVYSILIKKYTERYDNFLVTRRVMLWAFLTAVPLMLLTDGMPDLKPLFTTPTMLLSWLFLGVFGNAVCFAIWNIAFKYLGVVVTNNYLYGTPFVTLVVGFLVLNEQITVMSVVGAVHTPAGVIGGIKKPHTPPPCALLKCGVPHSGTRLSLAFALPFLYTHIQEDHNKGGGSMKQPARARWIWLFAMLLFTGVLILASWDRGVAIDYDGTGCLCAVPDDGTAETLPVSFHGTFRRGVYTGSCDIPGVLSCATLRAKFDGGTASALFVMDDSGFWAAAPLHSISVASDRSCAVIRLWTEHTVTDGHVSGRWDADNFSYVAIGDRNAARALAAMQ